MRIRDVGLSLLIILSLAAAASAQGGYSMQQSFDMTSGFSDEDIEEFFGFGDPFLTSGFTINTTYGMELGSAYSFFSEYYVESGAPIVGGIISAPKKIDIVKEVPTMVFLSGGQQIAYSQYAATIAPNLPTELWIRGEGAWSQYIVCPEGTWLQLIGNVPVGGQAEFYEITQTGPSQNSLDYKQYQFFAGYNTMSFQALKPGRHILMFIVNNQPSNVVIVDVFAQTAAVQQPAGSMPPASNMPPASQTGAQGTQYGAGATSYTNGYSTGTQMTAGSSTKVTYTSTQGSYQGTGVPVPTPTPTPTPSTGDTPVTIQTTMMGYDVYVDGVMIGKEGTGGDALDGRFSFRVVGGTTHTIRVFDGENNYVKPVYFERGVTKIINVPPGYTVYV